MFSYFIAPFTSSLIAFCSGDEAFTGVRFEAHPSTDYRFGVTVAASDFDGDGKAEIITGQGPAPGNDTWIRIFRGDGMLLPDGFQTVAQTVTFGVEEA